MNNIKKMQQIQQETRRAWFTVSEDLLRDALAMPEDSVIYGARWNYERDGLDIFVAGPELPEKLEGDPVPEITPQITADYDRKPGIWLTFDWNLED